MHPFHEFFNSKAFLGVIDPQELGYFLLIFKKKPVVFSAAGIMEPVSYDNQVVFGPLQSVEFLLV